MAGHGLEEAAENPVGRESFERARLPSRAVSLWRRCAARLEAAPFQDFRRRFRGFFPQAVKPRRFKAPAADFGVFPQSLRGDAISKLPTVSFPQASRKDETLDRRPAPCRASAPQLQFLRQLPR